LGYVGRTGCRRLDMFLTHNKITWGCPAPCRVQARHQQAVFPAAQRDVGDVVEEVRAPVAALERLRCEPRRTKKNES
jgi:hypothetical protein